MGQVIHAVFVCYLLIGAIIGALWPVWIMLSVF
jgi:hypothetical protein